MRSECLTVTRSATSTDAKGNEHFQMNFYVGRSLLEGSYFSYVY
jgi:hypothetical protein